MSAVGFNQNGHIIKSNASVNDFHIEKGISNSWKHHSNIVNKVIVLQIEKTEKKIKII